MSFMSTQTLTSSREISINSSQDKGTDVMSDNLEKHQNSINSQTVR